MHVFSDLQPYICTFPNCEDGLVQFSSRAAWADHEFSKHRNTRLWTCPDCPQEFHEFSLWEQHLQEKHCLLFSVPNLQVAKIMALKTEAKCTENDECPLCRIVVGKPRRGFVKHVGRHMEEIALMALPRDVEEKTEEESSSSELSTEENKDEHLSGPDVVSIKAVHKAEGPERASLMDETNGHSPQAALPETTTTSAEVPSYNDYFQVPDQGSFEHAPDDDPLSTSAQKRNGMTSVRDGERNESIDTNATYGDNDDYTPATLDPDHRLRITRGSLPVARNAGPASKHSQRSRAPSPAHEIVHNPTNLMSLSSLKASRSDLVNHLLPTEDGYNPTAYDEEWESKALPTEELPSDLAASSDIFCLPHRGEVQFMLATKGAAILGYRSVDLFFSQNESLDKIIATQQDKDELIARNILPYSHQPQIVAIVSAESVSYLTSGAENSSRHTSSSVIMPQERFYPSPLSLVSSPTDVNYSACGEVCTGELSDPRLNLQRHIRTTRRPYVKYTGVKCPMAECRDTARMRSVNLSSHLLNVHKIGSTEERQAIVAQCKSKARNVDKIRN